jgi:sporulation protein YlmC with PRC-barrel domain
MKLKTNLLAGAIVAASFPLATWAQPEPTHTNFGVEKRVYDFQNIEVRNLQDESLGRITDLGIDLQNGRIVEVLVASDSAFGTGGKIVAVPPLALIPDVLNQAYRLNVSAEAFRSAPGIDLSKWVDSGRSERVAAAYRLFGKEPYFLEEGQTASQTAARPRVPLGYIERSSRILDMPVANLQNEPFGKVSSINLDILRGRILSVIVLAPGNFKTRSVIPAMALSFNAGRDGLLLDDTKLEYADEPRYVFIEPAFGQKAYSKEEPYQGPHTLVALEQGESYRDVDRTVRINKDIRAAHIDNSNVEVATINGRVTLRGWVNSEEDRKRIGDIAIADSRLELVDNQVAIGKPAVTN